MDSHLRYKYQVEEGATWTSLDQACNKGSAHVEGSCGGQMKLKMIF